MKNDGVRSSLIGLKSFLLSKFDVDAFFSTQMNHEGSTHPMSQLRKMQKETANDKRPHASVLKAGQSHHCDRQGNEEHVRRMRTPDWLTALVVDVAIRRREDDGVAFSELRHDTTGSLHTHEQERDVQEQQVLHL